MTTKEHSRITALHTKFSATEEGKKLLSSSRFGHYKPEEVSDEQWWSILGADVNNGLHLVATFSITKAFVDRCKNPHPEWKNLVPQDAQFDPDDEMVLLTTAMVHDWAEAVVGDIHYNKKTAQDEETELDILRRMMTQHFGEEFPQHMAEGVITILRDKAQTKLGKAFQTIEEIGYSRTAMRAWEHVRQGNHVALAPHFRDLTGAVLSHSVPLLVDRSGTYPPAHLFLLQNEERIEHFFTSSAEGEFGDTGWENIEQRVEAAREKWHQFQSA